jgi:hypothetical protein
LKPDRHAWLQVTRGEVSFNGNSLKQGDGVAIAQEKQLTISADTEAEILLFDLA